MSKQDLADFRNLLRQIVNRETDASSLLQTLTTYGSPVRGTLSPGNSPDPQLSNPNCHPQPDAFKVYSGDSVAWKATLPLRAIEVGENDFVELVAEANGISVNATITAPDGQIIVNIRDGVFVANQNNTLERKVSADHTTLEITDVYGKTVLSIKFLNPHAVNIMGRFSSHGMSVIFDENKITYGKGNSLSGACVSNFGTAETAGFKFK